MAIKTEQPAHEVPAGTPVAHVRICRNKDSGKRAGIIDHAGQT
jgi:hypothetical protein